jgi:hypothetical protein
MAVMGITVDNSATIDANSTTNSGNAISSVPSGSWPADVFTNFKNVGGSLILPAAGYRSGSNGMLITRGSIGYFWSSTAATASSNNWGWSLVVYYVTQGTYDTVRADGFSVRCVAAE